MIKIICLGKLKEKYLVDALEEYKKRISKYSKLEIIELNDLENLEKERELIYRRYYQELSQMETSKVLGMSQVQVSRNETKILQKLKTRL